MSKVNVGVGDEFPVKDADEKTGHICAYRGRWVWHHAGRHRPGPVAFGLGTMALLSLGTLAVLNPVTTLAVTGAAGLAFAAGRARSRRERWRRWRQHHAESSKPEQPATASDASYTDTPPTDKKDN